MYCKAHTFSKINLIKNWEYVVRKIKLYCAALLFVVIARISLKHKQSYYLEQILSLINVFTEFKN